MNNFGQKKNAKEWQQLVVPLTPQRVEEMLNGSDLNLKDLTLASRVRVQVREEMRKTTLSKESRSIEISFPLPPDQRKRRLKEQILQAKKAKLDTMSLEDLEAGAKAEGLQAIYKIQKILKIYKTRNDRKKNLKIKNTKKIAFC